MPMVKWRVEPTTVSRIAAGNVQSRKSPVLALSDVTNHICINIIHQLSCLCKQSKEMFDEIEQMASNTIRRTMNLVNRVNSLKQVVLTLNPTVEQVSLDDIGAYKPFKSNTTKDVSFCRQRPQGVVDVYLSGQSVPALAKLNQFREDDKDCLKMYTNPDFFFEIWSIEIKKEVNEKKPNRKKRQAQAQAAVTIRAPKNFKQEALIDKVQRQNEAPAVKPKPGHSNSGPNNSKIPSPIHPPSTNEPKPPPLLSPEMQKKSGIPSVSDDTDNIPPPPKDTMFLTLSRSSTIRPGVPPPPPPPPPGSKPTRGKGTAQCNDLPLPPPVPSMPVNNSHTSQFDNEEEEDAVLPPPPPPILRQTAKSGHRGTLYSVSNFDRKTAFFPPPPPLISEHSDSDSNSSIVPPTPPPPPPAPLAPPPPPSGSILPTPESAFQLRPVNSSAQKRESRSDLLQAIKIGITLRKVEETKTADEVKQPTGGLFDVQTILEMRRRALEDDYEEDEDEEWDD